MIKFLSCQKVTEKEMTICYRKIPKTVIFDPNRFVFDQKYAFLNFLVRFMSKIEIGRSERFKMNHVYDFFTQVKTLFSQNLSKTSIFGRNCRTF